MALTDNIRAIWHMNNSDADASGRGNTLVRTGAVYSTTQVKLGSHALYFDNTDDSVSIGNKADFDFEYNTPFSFAGWMYPTAGSSETIISTLSGGVPYNGYELGLLSNKLRLLLSNSITSNYYIDVITLNAMSLNQYLFFVVSYDGSGLAAGIKMDINGVDVPLTISKNTLGARSIKNGIGFYLGRRQGLYEPFGGYLDELLVWERVVSHTEAVALYNGGIGMELNIGSSFKFCHSRKRRFNRQGYVREI